MPPLPQFVELAHYALDFRQFLLQLTESTKTRDQVLFIAFRLHSTLVRTATILSQSTYFD